MKKTRHEGNRVVLREEVGIGHIFVRAEILIFYTPLDLFSIRVKAERVDYKARKKKTLSQKLGPSGDLESVSSFTSGIGVSYSYYYRYSYIPDVRALRI